MSLKKIKEAFTFDDVLLIPNESSVIPTEVDVTTKITNKFSLKIPILAAAMDTVTESKMAIEVARNGGIAIIHKNMSIEKQAKEVLKVKRSEAGIVKEPYTLNFDDTVEDYNRAFNSYGVKTFPVVEKGTKKIAGVISGFDIRFAGSDKQAIKEIMTPKDKLVVHRRPIDLKKIEETMKSTRISKVIIVDNDDLLDGLVTSKDFHKINSYPNSLRDSKNRLVCGAAIGVGEKEFDRAKALIDAKVDLLIIDTAHGHSKNVANMVKKVRKYSKDITIVAGNIATSEAAKFLIDAGADILKVGIGPGSICTTRIISGVGIPQITAIMDVAEVCKPLGVGVIADGGIKQSGDIAKAIAAGADCVMIGSMLAGTDEAPGDLILLGGRSYKSYRGMGSLGAMNKGSADRYGQGENQHDKNKLVPEGIEGRVPYKGPVADVIYQLVGGLRSAMGYTGSKDIKTLQKANFVKITNAGLSESHVHDVTISREAPNYTLK